MHASVHGRSLLQSCATMIRAVVVVVVVLTGRDRDPEHLWGRCGREARLAPAVFERCSRTARAIVLYRSVHYEGGEWSSPHQPH